MIAESAIGAAPLLNLQEGSTAESAPDRQRQIRTKSTSLIAAPLLNLQQGLIAESAIGAGPLLNLQEGLTAESAVVAAPLLNLQEGWRAESAPDRQKQTHSCRIDRNRYLLVELPRLAAATNVGQ